MQLTAACQCEPAGVLVMGDIFEARPVATPFQSNRPACIGGYLPTRMRNIPVRLADRVQHHNVERQPEVVVTLATLGIRHDELLADRRYRAPLRIERILFFPCT